MGQARISKGDRFVENGWKFTRWHVVSVDYTGTRTGVIKTCLSIGEAREWAEAEGYTVVGVDR